MDLNRRVKPLRTTDRDLMPHPRKRFGQHFLRDPVVIEQILSVLALTPHEHAVEIGPGLGALTFPVLKQIKTLDAIELDRDLIATLNASAKKVGVLHLHEADVLSFDFSCLKKDERLLRVFGNLPYNISTPLLFHLLDSSSLIHDMTFMVQKEVAERLAALPDTKAYGRLSVMVQYRCQVDILFDVSPDAFYPKPRVQSSIIKLIPYRSRPYSAHDEALFALLVKQAFSQRRKTLRNSLKTMIRDDEWALFPISSEWRAEHLPVKDFVEMSNRLSKNKQGEPD